ncbi:hypothetical protein TWF696_004897 [Orbilia brochopaga]|uniref:carnosine N-methyltransferase n=1 Tax=Orbilia brochopaga TaxID=3140254 RepID=A0AAV9V0P1_9PEZI
MTLTVYERVLDTESRNGPSTGIHDPASNEDQEVLLATLGSFYLYRRAAHYTFTHRRRRNFYSLPPPQQQILQELGYRSTLDKVDECIAKNAAFAEAILKSGCDSFGIDVRSAEEWKGLADSTDLDKARSTMKQFLRDWSKEGAAERERCYGPILDAIDKYLGKVVPPCEVRILVPGAGLGRLPFEICKKGYATEGNEFSYHQLLASNFVLNNTTKIDEYTIHPFCLGFSHHRERDGQTRAITIPDVHPGTELFKVMEYQISDDAKALPPGVYRYRPSQYFSMSAGEFVDSYNTEEAKETYDCVATCFFIDTARNLLQYLETIRNVLVDGGLWINNGPLLWHWEGADATEKNEAGESKKDEVKSFEQVESHVEDAETPLVPPIIMPPRVLANTHPAASEHTHEHLLPSGFRDNHGTSTRSGAKSATGTATDTPSTDREHWRGSLEFSLDEVYQLIEMYGFRIIERGSTKTGYILDDKCMAKYIYESEFWVAVKTAEVADSVAASFTRSKVPPGRYQEKDGENEDKDKGKGKMPQYESEDSMHDGGVRLGNISV